MPDLFGPDIDAQIRCVERELEMRGRVYTRLIDQGKMTTDQANREAEAMKGVLHTLKAAQAWKAHLPPMSQFHNITNETLNLLEAIGDPGKTDPPPG